jgi:large subunit ribosomal protein L10
VNKEQKQQAVKEIGAELEASSAVFAVDYRGISVPQAAELRGKLGEADATFSIVKNRLAKRITADSGAEALDEHLVGPTALTYVRGDAVVAAKAIADFAKEHEILSYKGGIMEGEPLAPEQFKQIARLPGVEQLRGQLVGLAASPLTGLVQSLNGLIGGLATQLGQIAEQGLLGGEAAPEAEAEPAEAEAAEETSEQAEQDDTDAGDDSADEEETKED